MQTLRNIVNQAVAATATDSEGGLEANELYMLLDARGDANPHLVNQLNRDPQVYYFRPRQHPLTGDEMVNGRFLSLHYCGHDPFALLLDHQDLESLESSILSGAGILNPFTTYLIAFIDYRVAPFRIMYRGSDGNVVHFEKQDQYAGADPWGKQYIDSRVEWLGGEGT